MKLNLILAMLLTIGCTAGAATLGPELVSSGYVHSPLSADGTYSLQAEAEAKPVLKSLDLEGRWQARGELASLNCDTIPTLSVNFDTGTRRAVGSPDDPDYALYGHAQAWLDLNGQSLNGYNRLYLEIEPRCPGMRVVNINLSLHNRHRAAAGFNEPTGAHLIQLQNGRVNRCYLEIADLQRDCIDRLGLRVSVNGRDLPTADTATYIIRRVCAQQVEFPEKVSGWTPDPRRIVYSTSGYHADGRKTAIVSGNWSGRQFTLVGEADGKTALKGKIKTVNTTTGSYGVIDFSRLTTPGRYRLMCDKLGEVDITIGDSTLWDDSSWRVLSFIFSMRCGYAVPGVHSLCHADLFSRHEGRRHPYSGGWHDAGDLSQQTLQTGDVAFALLELYDHKRQSNPLLAARLREEALWGLDFVLRNRLGDGYHASSMGLLLWQDGIVDSHDDISTVRVQNCAYDNYLYAAYEAYAARVLGADGSDPMLCDYLRQAACEDYEFAERQFAASGYGGWISPYEHTYNTGESQWEATVSWAASQLYLLTGEQRYAADARSHADYVLACQQVEPVGGLSGFFYRNTDHRSVVHYIHQSREQLFMLAMTALCESQPEHADYSRWHRSVEDYGRYIKSLMQYTAPYGMIPAGIYRSDEAADSDAFYALHLFPPADASERFEVQAAQGEHVAPGWFVKRFPVWFNIFNGNLAVHSSMGKAAALCARCLDDPELKEIAREQLYWIVGKNPFAQSLIYGEGRRYPSLNNFSSGELTGAMPVGIRSLGDSDEPYWPNINNACYKEVWLTSAGKWLSLLADVD